MLSLTLMQHPAPLLQLAYARPDHLLFMTLNSFVCATARHPTAFLLYANGRPSTDLDKLGGLVQSEADKLVTDGPTPKELNRVKKVLRWLAQPAAVCQRS